jgi:hypothetical protein
MNHKKEQIKLIQDLEVFMATERSEVFSGDQACKSGFNIKRIVTVSASIIIQVSYNE